MTQPHFTIIIPCFNAGLLLSGALESIERWGGSCEVIVVDGGSSDETSQIVKKFSKQVTHFVSEPDSGIYDAMNKGVRLAQGRFFYFLGADDRLAVSLKSIEPIIQDVNTIYYGRVRLQPSGRLLGGYSSRTRLLFRNISHQAIFYPCGVFNRHFYEPLIQVCADHALNLELAFDTHYCWQYIPDCIVADFAEGGVSSKIWDASFEKFRRNFIFSKGTWFEKSLFSLWDRLRRKPSQESNQCH